MRSLIFILVALCALPSDGQERVFRASSIDVEQDIRLDAVEQRVAVLEGVPTSQPPRTQDTPKQHYIPANMVKTTAAKAYAVITIESLPGCSPCERWKSKEARELRAQGWTVIEAPLTSSSSAPFFRICIGDKCYSHSGFMSHGSLRAIIAKAQPLQAATRSHAQRLPSVSARYSTAELRSIIHAKRPGGWTGPVYADVSPRSQAKQHLVGPEHGFSWDQVSGLTQDEALILHDLAPRHGNQIFPTRSKR